MVVEKKENNYLREKRLHLKDYEVKKMTLNYLEVKNFFGTIVPQIEKDEVLIVMVAARKKYDPTLSRSKEMLDTLIIRSNDIVVIMNELTMLEAKANYYRDYKTRELINKKALAYYIDLYPKSIIKSWGLLSKEMNQWIYEALKQEKYDYHNFRNIEAKLFSALAKSSSRRPIRLLDVDTKDENFLNSVLEKLPKPNWITQTRGGFHVLFSIDKNLEKEIGKACYEVSKNNRLVEFQTHQCLTPIPGTLQGGLEVVRVKE